MKIKLLTSLLACACVSLARADFNPIALTPDSYTFDIVVEADAPQALPDCINATVGSGLDKGDNTLYEQGFVARKGQEWGNEGIPPHNTVFTNINDPNMTFLMPPDYTVNNDLLVDASTVAFYDCSLNFSSPTTATGLAFLCTSGGGAISVNYTVSHQDGSTETGAVNLLDWFTGGTTVAWGANGRITAGGTYNNSSDDTNNTHVPYLYAETISITNASPITKVTFDTPSSSAHANFFAVSGSTDGINYTPIRLDPSSFDVMAIVPATFPLTATMDQGTNTSYNGNLATWFEQGYDRSDFSAGLPASGTTFSSFSQPTHYYSMGDYTTNNAVLIDTNHQVANITPASPSSYTAISFLTAGGNISGIMTNACIIQHQDGVNETNVFYGYDWYDGNHNSAIALKVNGRVEMSNRTLQSIEEGFPYLFESYFLLNDTTSPVTNIVLKYKSAINANSTTYVMAVSGATGGIAPVVNEGPTPSSQTVWPGTNASFTVGVTGDEPITGYWQVEDGPGNWVTLADGVDANGSTISGSQTTTLTISNIFPADGTNYQYVANNSVGTGVSAPATLIVSPQTISITPAAPVFYTSNTIPLTVHLSDGPAVSLQWYYIDPNDSGTTNFIPDATNVTYTIASVPLSLNNYTYGVIASNIYDTNTASVILNISDSAAFLGSDLPAFAETYAGSQVTYVINAQGNSPINYQWMVNGILQPDVNTNAFTLSVPCGTVTVQVLFTNALSGGLAVTSSVATLQGDAYPTNITFNGNGQGWQSNTNGHGNPGTIVNNVLTLTDGGGGEASSAFYNAAQYVGGSWTASFIYNSHGGSADGAAFILQNVGTNALGGPGGYLGLGGDGSAGNIPITNSLAFEINLYNGNTEIPGITVLTDGLTGSGGGNGNYHPTDPVSMNSTNPIAVTLNWDGGVLSVLLTDTVTGDTYTTNWNLGSLVPILGGNVAYIGFSAGDGGATSLQTISGFSFHSVLAPVTLSVSPMADNSFILSWPADDPTYKLQTATSLSSPVWVDGPTPVDVDGTDQVTVDASSGNGQQFFRLIREVCE